ncbi:hypothetical protein ACLOJK_000334 [Asimina triloba]
MAEVGGDGLLGGEQVLVADEEDNEVGGFRPNGAIGGDEGGDATVEGFDSLVEGEGIVVGELIMGEVSVQGGEDLEDVIGHVLGASKGLGDAHGRPRDLTV